MMQANQFTYTVNSINKYNAHPTIHQFAINFGNFGSEYDNFQVQCTSILINIGELVTKPYYISLSARNLAEQSYCSALNSNECILGAVTTSSNGGGILNSAEGSIFRVQNVRIAREIVFTLRGLDLNPLTTQQAPHDTIYIQCTLLFTPIV
jgi:hypothetical protein